MTFHQLLPDNAAPLPPPASGRDTLGTAVILGTFSRLFLGRKAEPPLPRSNPSSTPCNSLGLGHFEHWLLKTLTFGNTKGLSVVVAASKPNLFFSILAH